MSANFFWVTVQKPPYGQGENHVQLAYGVDGIGPDTVVAPRLFGASYWKVAVAKAAELGKSLDLPVYLNVPDDAKDEIKKALVEAGAIIETEE